jgi:polyhydroxyalkanoate synthesis regulator phasin
MVAWLVGLSAAMFLANQVLTFYKVHIKEQPSPSTTYATKEEHTALRNQVGAFATKEEHAQLRNQVGAFATKSEHEKLEQRVNGLSAEIKDGFRELDKKRSVSIAGLHDDLNTGLEKVHKRIDELPNRVISLLKDTRELNR